MIRYALILAAGVLLGYRWRKSREPKRKEPRPRTAVPRLDPGPRRAAVLEALRQRIPVWIEYTDARGRTTTREVVPLRDLDNCVRAWCSACRMLRHFRYDRIRQLRLLGGSAEDQRQHRVAP